MKLLVIYNPAAGLKRRDELQIIIKYLTENNFDYEVHKTQVDFGPDEILASSEHKVDVIIVAGGDGTVSQSINAVHKYGWACPILLLPLGTTNEISQNLGQNTSNLISQLEKLKTMNTISLDYGLVNNSKTFTYALTFGNFTEVTYKTPQKMKNWLGYRAYILYGFLTFRKIKKYRVHINSDEASLGGNYVFGAVSNSSSMGNIFHYNDDKISLTDGLFEVLLISKPNSVKELRLILTGMMQNDYSNEMFTTFKSRDLIIKTKQDIDWNIDGEYGGSYKKLEIENKRQSIQLII
ncbi:diacylglycerol kinase family protein [Erysipelothrix urinaevulpis]|uniref:diacylglycerol/lipid kinase family protein n=1 Tax=Erysipelothrix urinaevulpis TaxID=2683717 RepID=UPI001356FF0D|nr:YegS/Rv2252/BmrU family lipid kinase [Erysipelothrix urinaevulpis]